MFDTGPRCQYQHWPCRSGIAARGACIDDLNFEDLYVETTASAAQAEASALAAYDDIDIVSRPTATLSNVD